MRRMARAPTVIDAQVIERVYREQFTRFWKGMVAITGNPDDAREAVQEGFARALAARATYRGEGSVEGWIWRIALNAAADLRRGTREQPLEDAFSLELPHPESDPALSDALRRLPTRQRLLIFLHYLADLSYEDAARICGISEGAVGASLWKARQTLATLLEEQQSPGHAPPEGMAGHG
jgi:RNA polymerase sigma-70 factor (ECF subfamily)